MPNLRGASPVGRVGGGRSDAARTDGSRRFPQRPRVEKDHGLRSGINWWSWQVITCIYNLNSYPN